MVLHPRLFAAIKLCKQSIWPHMQQVHVNFLNIEQAGCRKYARNIRPS